MTYRCEYCGQLYEGLSCPHCCAPRSDEPVRWTATDGRLHVMYEDGTIDVDDNVMFADDVPYWVNGRFVDWVDRHPSADGVACGEIFDLPTVDATNIVRDTGYQLPSDYISMESVGDHSVQVIGNGNVVETGNPCVPCSNPCVSCSDCDSCSMGNVMALYDPDYEWDYGLDGHDKQKRTIRKTISTTGKIFVVTDIIIFFLIPLLISMLVLMNLNLNFIMFGTLAAVDVLILLAITCAIVSGDLECI